MSRFQGVQKCDTGLKWVKRLKTIDLLSELPFYEEVEKKVVEEKDSIQQLDASKSSIKDLFSGLLNETRGFK